MGNGKLFSKKSGNVRVFRLVNRSVMGDTAEVDEHGNPLPDRVFAEVTPGLGEDDYEDIEEDEGEDVDVGDEEEVDQQMYHLDTTLLILFIALGLPNGLERLPSTGSFSMTATTITPST
jgi:hypothetical protein